MNCTSCPRHCEADRVGVLGFCQATNTVEVSAVCRHTGEEPPLTGKSGVCNVFFAHCNLQCEYCQNYQISRGILDAGLVRIASMDELVEAVLRMLPLTENVLGLVSPSHYAEHIPELIERIHQRGFQPTVVYNSGGYDDAEVLKRLEPWVDVYLPDLKYADSRLAADLSHAADYPEKAGKALKEMYRQKGSSLITDENEVAQSGMIIRHLVLPGMVENSLHVLDWIADNISTNIHISLMAQYCPTEGALSQEILKRYPQLNRTLREEEYDEVVEHYYDLGFHKGWVQELKSAQNYNPDFCSEHEMFLEK